MLKQIAHSALKTGCRTATPDYSPAVTAVSFVPMIRYWNGNRIWEEYMDTQVVNHTESLREIRKKEQASLQQLYKRWSLRQPALDREIARLREEIHQTEEDIDELLMLRIQSAK